MIDMDDDRLLLFFLSSTHLYDLNNAKYVLIHHEDAQDQIKESEMTCNIYP